MYVSTRYGWLSGPVQVWVAHPTTAWADAVHDDAGVPPVIWPVEDGIEASLE